MKNDSVSSYPNDTIAIIVQMVENKFGTYTIVPLEVAFGKIGEDGDFTCMDNSAVYESINENVDNYDEDVQYYGFAKNIEELKETYGEKLSGNALMISYFKDVLKTMNIAFVKDDTLDIHSIPVADVEARSGDPIIEVNNTSVIKPATSFATITKEKPNMSSVTEPEERINPLKDEIDLDAFERFMKSRIVGNDDTIENICTTLVMNLTAEDPKDVENLLSIGPTGSGKSQSFKNVSEYLDIPVVICDSTQLSAAGYVGKDVEDYLKDIYLRSNGKIELANRAIFVLDEIDKLKSSGLEMKEAAQDTLLKVIEGQAYTIELDKQRGSSVVLDTTGMTIVGCGAFSSIFEERRGEGKKRKIGFGTDVDVKEEKKIKADDPIILAPVTDEELKKFGFKPEFIPRFQNRNVYRELDKDGLRLAYTTSGNSALLAKIRRYLKQFNCEVIYDDSFIDAVVEEAYALQCGGRSLNRINSTAFKQADREMLKMDKTKKKVLKLTGDTVKDPRKIDIK